MEGHGSRYVAFIPLERLEEAPVVVCTSLDISSHLHPRELMDGQWFFPERDVRPVIRPKILLGSHRFSKST